MTDINDVLPIPAPDAVVGEVISALGRARDVAVSIGLLPPDAPKEGDHREDTHDDTHGASDAEANKADADSAPPSSAAPPPAPASTAPAPRSPSAPSLSPLDAIFPGLSLPHVDTSRLADAAIPLAATAMMAAPMIGQALSGLLGGQNGNSSGGVSPEAARAMQVLNELESLYGSGALAPGSGSAPTTTGSGSGTAGGLDAYQRSTLYKKNAASAYTKFDAELGLYLTGLAGQNKSAAAALAQIRADAMTQVRAIGADALTPAGRTKIDALMVQALQRALTVVGDSQTKTDDIAKAVDHLADSYLIGLIRGADPGANAGLTAVNAAMAQLGKPYVFATAGPDTFDCSGLTKFAAAKAGVTLPHNAAAQYASTRHINPSDIRPGDLIYPMTSLQSDGTFGHVQLYIGNGLVVQASGKGIPVRVSKLPSDFRASRWT